MAFTPEIPASLVPGTGTAASRRVLAGVAAPNGVPAAPTDGVATGFVLYLSFVVLLIGAGSTVSYRIWYFHRASQTWCVDTRPAPTTGGTVTLAVGDPDNPQLSGAEIIGWERVYIEITAIAGAGTVDAWIEGVTF